MKTICGIDYSMTSPAITIHTGDEWNISNCKFYYLSKTGKIVVNDGVFHGQLYPAGYTSEYSRYERLASWTLKNIIDNEVEKCYIEDYAFAATGKVFHIAENTGLMKYSLWNLGIPFETYAPTSIKKYATGKGNAKKEDLYAAWLTETGIDIRASLGIKSQVSWNPVSDIVDSYYIAKKGFYLG